MRLYNTLISTLVVCAITCPALAEECDPTDARLLKPDLVALEPLRARVIQRNGARRLYFTTRIANVGQGPLVVEAQTVDTPGGPVTQATQVIQRSDGTTCTHSAGSFDFHPSHHHWHLDDFAEYQLRRDDPYTGPLVARAKKVSFCLLDMQAMRGSDGSRQVDGDCTQPDGVQGISVGWMDVYDDYYPDQFLELDTGLAEPVPAGSYFLVNVPDPDDLLLEVDEDSTANAGFVSVAVRARIGSEPIPVVMSPTPTPTPSPTPTLRRPGPRPRPTRQPRPTRPVRSPRPPRTPVLMETPTPTPTSNAGTDACPSAPAVCPASPACLTRNRLGKLFYAYPGTDRTVEASGFFKLNRASNGINLAHELGSLALVDERGGTVLQMASLRFIRSGPDRFVATTGEGTVTISPSQDGYDFAFTFDDPGLPAGYFSLYFDLCLSVGDDGIFERIVCQPKPRGGLLCHSNI